MAVGRRSGQHAIATSDVAVASLAVSFPGAATVGDMVAVGVGTSSATVVVNDNQSNTYVQDASGNASGLTIAYLFSALNVSQGGGAFTVTANLTGGNAAVTVAIAEYSGVRATGALDVTRFGGGLGQTSLTSGTGVTTTFDDEICVACVALDSARTITQTGTFSASDSVATVPSFMLSDLIQVVAGSQQATWTVPTSTDYNSAIATYKGLAPALGFHRAATRQLPLLAKGVWDKVQGQMFVVVPRGSPNPPLGPTPFALTDWPNPRGYSFPTDLLSHLQPGLRIVVIVSPIVPSDWPNPLGYAYPLDLRTWLNAPSPGSLLAPFAQRDWPNPWGYPYSVEHRTWLQNLKQQLAGQDVQFRGPGQWTTYDYPNPRGYPYPSDLRTHLQPGLQVVVVLPPIIPSDWPNPRGYVFPVELRGWLYVPSPAALLSPFFQSDWPNPSLGKAFPSDLRTYIFTLPPGVLLPPFAQFDWPVPKGAPFPSDLRTFVNGVEIQLIGQDVMYGAPGQVPTYNIENPRGAPNQVAWLYDVHGVFVGWFPAPPAGAPPLIYLLHSGKWAKKITDRVYIEIG